MTETVAFPDVEALLVGWLPAALAGHGEGAPVHGGVPNPRPGRFVRVRRTGGPRDGLIVDAATVTVECWADGAVDAASLARLVRALIGSLPGRTVDGTPVYRVQEFSGPASMPDPTSGQARYTWTVALDVRGRPI